MNYAEGDEIFCFGFSRGAYTARSVAGLITDIGIITPQEMNDFPDLYELYRKFRHDDSFNFRRSKEYRQWITGIRNDSMPHCDKEEDPWLRMPHKLPPESSRVVEVVGVFDTVGALGIPGRYQFQMILNYIAQYLPFSGIDYQGFHNTSMSKSLFSALLIEFYVVNIDIKHAFHALALDEHIKPFTPTLWHLPQRDEQCPKSHRRSIKQIHEDFIKLIKKGSSATEEQLSEAWSDLIEAEMAVQLKDAEPDLRQVWFPGGHVNVGGGNPAILMGFPFDFEQEADEGNPSTVSSSLAHREIISRKRLIHSAKHKNFGSFWPLQLFWRGLDYMKIYIASATVDFDEADDSWATGLTIDIFDILNMFLISRLFVFFLKVIPFMSSYRTPGEYNKDTAQGGTGKTNEQIHPSVHYRKTKIYGYGPKSLEGFSRSKRMEQKDGKLSSMYEWTKGTVVIPEYMIKKTDYISRHLVRHSSAKDFIIPLMEKEESKELNQ
ncbi:uncharacterized protein ColSpa_01802 [Colletotrichum spaethianum]|uniref:T6SS Phospholipase effector Tle1-like catalytic domain-containing protein n=1 Tax=Colletotrichum spaethianum TaxID=700344 RepID=A0AA37L437_9PEZI|nr:uncharacterized protein ColSpa_01802 [Colletotrichum spaethianum]GKT41621.1 hypothetical protein ColSpa_01802 [Colletotrichum spaethianum]